MRTMMIRTTMRCLSIALVAATPALAQRAVSRAELDGEWTGPIALDAGTQMLAVVFRASDSALAGTVYSDGVKFGEMKDLSLARDTVHFKIDQLDFTGVIDGATMKVALIVYNGSTRHLTLKKTPKSGDESTSARRQPDMKPVARSEQLPRPSAQ